MEAVTEVRPECAGSRDPNQKLGAAGYGPANYWASDRQISYRIDFENVETASAPAQFVTVRDPLSESLDLTSLELAEIGFGEMQIVVPPGRQYYQTVVDYAYKDDDYDFDVEVHVEAWLEDRVFSVNFITIDPNTGLPPPVDIGFLPPENDTGRGKGYVSLLVRPATNLTATAEIRNVAKIQFDGNLEIKTNQSDPLDPNSTDTNREALVTVDAAAPTSSVTALPPSGQTQIVVQWSGSDAGSGVSEYNVYVSANGNPYTLWLAGTTNTQAVFTGVDGTTYRFRSEAIDNVGNTEAPWSNPSSEVNIDLPIAFSAAYPSSGRFVMTWNSRPSREYQILVNTNLLTPAGWTNITGYLPASGYSLTYTNTAPPARAFYKIHARDLP